MKNIFFGTPVFAAKILEFLAEKNVPLEKIVTQPDKPQGRSQKLSFTPVKKMAKICYPDVEILQPIKASSKEFIEKIAKERSDHFIVVGYGQILRKALLESTKLPINIHASLLPKYRGASPIQRVLMDGEKETGITIMQMNEKMDEGDVLLQESFEISEDLSFGELEKRLIDLSCKLILQTLLSKKNPTPQDHKKASYAPKLDPSEFFLDWENPSHVLHNQVRALSPKPGAWCFIHMKEKKRLKILRTKIADSINLPPKKNLIDESRFFVGTKNGALEILELQLEGKKSMEAKTFLRGLQVPISF